MLKNNNHTSNCYSTKIVTHTVLSTLIHLILIDKMKTSKQKNREKKANKEKKHFHEVIVILFLFLQMNTLRGTLRLINIF